MTKSPFLVFSLLLLISYSITFAQSSGGFTDITESSGITFRYNFGDRTYQNILESSGSGITIIDYNNDGLMDILFLNGTYLEGISDETGLEFKNSQNALYRNNGDLTFTEVTSQAGLTDSNWSMAAGALDYDNDGDTDLFLLNYGPNIFYENQGDGTFKDITDDLGLAGPEKLNGFTKWSVSCAFWDYNQDGRVDIMVGNFLAFDPDHVSPTFPDMMPHPAEYKGQASLLYLQNEDGSFSESTEQAGFYYPDSKCMGLTVFDYDSDGDLDLFQGNDHQRNFMFRNDGDAQFSEVAEEIGVAVNDNGEVTGSMHGTVGDIDGDGNIDLLVTDLKHGAMYKNHGNGVFSDVTSSSGLAAAFHKKGQWAANLFDFDNDGDLDLFAANGTAEELILQYPLLMENDGSAKFVDVGQENTPYFATKRSGRGGAVADFDNDGDLEIVISHVDLIASPVLLRNNNRQGNWLGLELKGKTPGNGIGAEVIIELNNRELSRINQWSNTYLSSNDPRVHIGLGEADVIRKLSIKWPGGTIDSFENIGVNQYLRIFEGQKSIKIIK